LNWFHARGACSNGGVEGMNNKAKLTIEKTYGLKSFKSLETHLSHQLGKLPEPQSTHRFC
jgi:transposase